MKKYKLPLAILFIVGLLVVVYFIQVPCGGMNENGDTWVSTCPYGSVLFKNIQNGNFFLPPKP